MSSCTLATRDVVDALPQRLVRKALTIRRTEERLLQLFAEGKVFGTVHTCIGQEWIGVAVAETLRRGDYVFSNHRGHGHYLARTDDVEGLIAEVMGRTTGVCGGRGGSQHLCRDGFFSNGIQGGIVPVAAGLAMAQDLSGTGGIAVVFLGDGTLGEGVVYETFNIAATWNLPLLIVLEDNGIAQSTPQSQNLSGTICGRAEAFGIETIEADTWDVPNLLTRCEEAAGQVRRERRPVLLHVQTYRLRAHSKGDDDRNPEEVARYAARDPLNRLLADPSPEIQGWLAEIDERINAAIAKASAASFPVIEVAEPHASRDASASQATALASKPRPGTVAQAIRDALADAMRADERILVLGEDVCDPYGGAFKVTAGLGREFGHRVRNTPISEAAIVGIGNGLALAGYRPIVEIMFGDFLMLAADQILNHAAKFTWMYNDQVRVPLLIRTPMGGYRGYGPTHSQSLEKHVLGIPGTRVLALHRRFCPYQLYRTLLTRINRPTIVLENKQLYTERTDAPLPQGCKIRRTGEVFPTISISSGSTPDLTLLAYGGMAGRAEDAMVKLLQDEELACELLIPTSLYPLDLEPIRESVRRTRRLLIVEEGQGFAAFGSEVLARLLEDPHVGPFRAARVHAAPCPIPASRPAEQACLPSIEGITRRAVELCSMR